MPKVLLCALTAFVFVVGCAVGCAEEKKVVRQHAQPKGTGLFVAAPVAKVVPGTSCAEDIVNGISERFRSAAAGALSNAGFGVVNDEKAPLSAKIEITVDYCSDAGIVSGSTALSLEKEGKGMIWRGQVTGDAIKGTLTKQRTDKKETRVEQLLFTGRRLAAPTPEAEAAQPAAAGGAPAVPQPAGSPAPAGS